MVSQAAQRSALDERFPKKASKHQVYASGGTLYAAMLNQTALVSAAAPTAGHNKYYSLQVSARTPLLLFSRTPLLTTRRCSPPAPSPPPALSDTVQVVENNKQTRFWVFKRWGRVGAKSPQTATEECSTLQAALTAFKKVYTAKTGGNHFGDGGTFKPVEGKYTHVEIDYEEEAAPLARDGDDDGDEPMTDESSDGGSPAKAALQDGMDVDEEAAGSSSSSSSSSGGGGSSSSSSGSATASPAASALPPSVLSLMTLLTDVGAFRRLMAEDFRLDVERAPLGRLSAAQISRGMEVLTQIEELLHKKQGLGAASRERVLTQLCGDFYTLVPHAFGMARPPLIDDLGATAAKARMLQDLGHMSVADGLLRATVAGAGSRHPMDQVYGRLRATLAPLEAGSATFARLAAALADTHAPTHKATFSGLTIEAAFAVERDGEASRFAPFDALPNHQLLWHGSRITNAVGILSEGLRVAPPEAPSTGYMFGKGVYFADLSSKAANYCHATADAPHGVLLLCEVATGTAHPLLAAKSLARPPSPCHSVKGVGRSEPRPTGSAPLDAAAFPPVVLHSGEPTPNAAADGSKLLYNEWIVYDEAQIKIRYLLKVKFEGMR